MGTHPNTILMVVFTTDDTSRKTHRAILNGADPESKFDIGSNSYHSFVMEEVDGYNKDFQITAPEGSVVFFDHVTYGYGEVIEWDALQAQKDELDAWAKNMCERHKCSHTIFVSANYW